MVANVAVRNWRFLYKMGISGCQWFDGLGSYLQIRKTALCGADSPTIGPDSPVVLAIKVLYTYPGKSAEEQAQGHMGRAEMIATLFREYERQIRQQLTDMFARTGFEASRDITGIILNRWGHAYASPAQVSISAKTASPRARCSAGSPVWKDRFREHGSIRDARSQVFDSGGGSRGGTVAESSAG